MKKFLVAILAFFYLGTSSGATFHFHYCMGKLVEWSLSHSNSDKCSNCGMEKHNEKDNGCCKDEHKQIKLEKDQKVTWPAFKLIYLFSPVILTSSFIQLPDRHVHFISEENPVSHAPPRSNGVAVYILNSLFRI